ncbi:MAG TPA: DNA translocase FtsK 4TM domain-containing protein [Chthoniobacterales bacterium]|nr:DNA translocase FtsK 4TM domain-containing protein [Chthoniobacterales bacterium]
MCYYSPVARRATNNAWNEVYALILLGIGTLLFLALISYVPKDIPTWFPLLNSTSSPNHPAQNFLGPIGAVCAGICYFLIGGASYLLAATLLGFGGAKLFYGELNVSRRAVWIALFVASGACLLNLQPWFLHDWHRIFKIQGAGGWVGYFFGRHIFRLALGKGSVIVLAGIYLTSLILMTGLRPVYLVRQSVLGLRRGFVAFRLWMLHRRMRRSNLKEQLEISQQQINKQQRALEKKLRKKGAPAPEPEILLEEFANRPERKVVDTTALPAGLPTRKKPSLADLKRGKKSAGVTSSTPALTTAQDWDAENYELPGIDLLEEHDNEGRVAADPRELEEIQATLIETLGQFGIQVAPGDITKGPTITRYEVYPAKGVRVDKIVSLERDLARATRAERINILAPIPGKDTVGIELANSRKVKVTLRELLQSEDWNATTAKLPIALGKDVYGKTIIADLAQMPHLLVAGTTGSGKSVCINALIASMLYRFMPDQLRFIMIDPKVVEMQVYNTLPHLVIPVVTDPKKVLLALRWVIDEMEKRYKIFAKAGVRNITSFNARPPKKTQKELDLENPPNESVNSPNEKPATITVPRDGELIVPDHMPYIVVIIDELADLMQTAPADVESAIARITQMARAAGIHLIVATQTPRADVITGVIKANIPSRIAFQVASKIDSRVILDENGADRLLGQGDMLYLPPSTSRLIRAQGVLVTDEEIGRLVDFVSAQSPPAFDLAAHEQMSSTSAPNEDVSEEDEELVEKCLEIIRQEKRASTSLLQRRLRLGYTRAARIVDILEQRGILGPGEGAKPREILVDLDAAV